MNGTVKFFTAKGFGFIEPDEGTCFVHASALEAAGISWIE